MENQKTAATTTTTTNKKQLTTFIRTLTSLLPSLFLSFNPPLLLTLPFDLVVEILCRLPAKVLLQLRCVCKLFNTLISDPHFAKIYLRMSTTRHHLILTSTDVLNVISYPLHSIFNSDTIKANQLHFPFNNQFYYVVGCCHGILCFVHDRLSIILWNPTIRKLKKLPSMEISMKCDCATYGFGYDPSKDNYKVVAIFSYVYGYGVPKAKIMVHILGTNSWRMIDGDFPVSSGLSLKHVSGTLNWLEYTDNFYNLVSFDLVNESCRKFSPPNYGVEDVDDVILGVLKDCLCISGHTRAFSSVWLMKEYGNEESWIKLYSVPYMNDPFRYYGYTKPIWISEDDQVLMECKSALRLYQDNKEMNLIVYDVENGTFKIPNTDNINGWITPVVCIESLVSPCF